MRKQKYGLIFYEKKQGVSKQVILEVLSWVFYTVIAVVSAALIVSAFGYRIVMTGASMMPGIRNGQYVLVNRVIYHLSSPKRGDMVV
ncbi:MAG: S26 family signal peptidase, partial [Lachnospiraceae bacterium]|nr:S26 family signal peptidase [Lachnospiraceae bacterium]